MARKRSAKKGHGRVRGKSGKFARKQRGRKKK